MKNIAIIPARSGSKGLKNKNIRCLKGKPLLAYSIESAIRSELFDTVMVSTDSANYAEVAKSFHAEVPFIRSEKNSADVAGSWDVVDEVLQYYYNKGIKYDSICLLQPTSPLRTCSDIQEAYELFLKKSADSIISVTEAEHPLEYYCKINNDLSISDPIYKMQHSQRQEMEKFHRINGAIYIRKIKYLEDIIDLLQDKQYAYVMKRFKSVDIDCEEDFLLAEKLIEISDDN